MSKFPIRSIIFITCMLSSIISVSTTRAIEVQIPAVEGRSGQTINVPVIIDETDNLAGIKLVMSYDKDTLMFKKSSKTEHTGEFMHVTNDKIPGELIVVMASPKGISGKGFPILNLTFGIKSGIKEKKNTQISISKVQLMSDKLKEEKGGINIKPITILPEETKASSK
ncbi:MAG: hypothetical protein JRJ23_02465 [Deltaproteobacteria bacterium]|nr:hypothetical protein [Deltaproteobacteria bacterium]MBW1915478.1 hypothetical protein [Deltaproteobacteria bacterium]